MIDDPPLFDQPELPSDGEPDDSSSPSEPNNAVAFALTVNAAAIDHLLTEQGLCPTSELRLTIAQELQRYAPVWIEDIVEQVATRIKFAN